MQPHIKHALIVFALLVVAMALIPPAIVGWQAQAKDFKPFASGFTTFLYNYQTLITGVLAIIGAGITVYQMRVSDRAETERHEKSLRSAAVQHHQSLMNAAEQHREALFAASRRDYLMVERALIPQVRDLDMAIKKMMLPPPAERPTLTFENFQKVCASSILWKSGIIEIQSILDRPDFKAGRELFNGTLSSQCDRLQVFMIRELLPVIERLLASAGDGEGMRRYFEMRQMDMHSVLARLLVFRTEFGTLLDHLYKLGEQYAEFPEGHVLTRLRPSW